MRFLIVDDNENKIASIQQLLKRDFPSAPFRFDIADVTSDAILLLNSIYYDFVIIDLSIPTIKDGIKDPNGGINLLRTIKHKKSRGNIKFPANIIILSEYAELISSNEGIFKELHVFALQFSDIDSQWKNGLSTFVSEYIDSINSQSTPSEHSPLIILSVHGISTYGQWQNVLDEMITSVCDSVTHVPYKYCFFPIIPFLVPALREREISRLIQELTGLGERYPDSTVNIIAHSFGTYLVYETLSRLNRRQLPMIGKVIFYGSVLKSKANIHKIITAHDIKSLTNECAIHDRALLASHIFALGLGMGGIEGFKGSSGKRIINRYHDGDHSSLFDKPDMMTQWVQHLAFDKALDIIDVRPPLDGLYSQLKATIKKYSNILVYIATLMIIIVSIW
ncbi:alpha/beta hydrolase [Aeromonas veronii]|uniref:response regulator n=1 Tax=Aeromonas veronii TaxID=654 RepID=UPI003A1CC219